MAVTEQGIFLLPVRNAAASAGHAWPDYAACEAALESNWGKSDTFGVNNPFRTRQRVNPVHHTYSLKIALTPTGAEHFSNYIWFPNLVEAFIYRWETLNQFRAIYRDALVAKTGEDFIRNVSAQWFEVDKQSEGAIQIGDGWYEFIRPRWSIDPLHAAKVLEIYDSNKAVFAQQEVAQ